MATVIYSIVNGQGLTPIASYLDKEMADLHRKLAQDRADLLAELADKAKATGDKYILKKSKEKNEWDKSYRHNFLHNYQVIDAIVVYDHIDQYVEENN